GSAGTVPGAVATGWPCETPAPQAPGRSRSRYRTASSRSWCARHIDRYNQPQGPQGNAEEKTILIIFCEPGRPPKTRRHSAGPERSSITTFSLRFLPTHPKLCASVSTAAEGNG